MSPTELRSQITSSIIESLNNGKIPWRKPWVSIDGPRFPTNFVSKRPYSGINPILLFIAEQKNNFPISYWATFNQWRSIGAKIKKGSKATQIVFWTQIKKEVDGEEKTFPILRSWSVFNIAQAEGEVVNRFNAKPELKSFVADRTEFDLVVNATNAKIEHGFEFCAYIPSEDKIVMPDVGRFDSFETYASTVYHELGHWTESRLGVNGSYAQNELRAELASSYLMAATGIPYLDDLKNTKAYIQSWISALKNDPKALFDAATKASRSADYILSFSKPELVAEPPIEEEPSLV